MHRGELHRATELLRRAARPVAFTGAGMSAESGIPTFRGRNDSLWAKYSIAQLATPEAYLRDKDLVWGWYVWRMAMVRKAVPNAGHGALAALQARWPDFRVVTQNVDDLHERAGSGSVAHLHGEILTTRCFACAEPHEDVELPLDAQAGEVERRPPPRCRHCGGFVRPGVVWFGESLPRDAWTKAERWLQEADLVLVVGTSGQVEPAASLARDAKRRGKQIIEINPDASDMNSIADVWIKAGAGSALPALKELLVGA